MVELGTGSASTVNLYPGGVFTHNVVSTRLCENASSCPAQAAGLYNVSASSTAFHNFTFDDAHAGEWGSELALNESSAAEIAIDQLSFQQQTGPPIIVLNVTMCALYEANIRLPNSVTYQQPVGNLALGNNPSDWTLVSDGGVVEGQVLTGWLVGSGVIPSESWGLHIGSASYRLEGSLI